MRAKCKALVRMWNGRLRNCSRSGWLRGYCAQHAAIYCDDTAQGIEAAGRDTAGHEEGGSMIRNHTTPEGQELGKTLTKCVDPDGCHFVRLGTVACSGRGGCSLRMARNSPLQWGNFCARFPETANRIDAALSSAGYEIRKKEDAR